MGQVEKEETEEEGVKDSWDISSESEAEEEEDSTASQQQEASDEDTDEASKSLVAISLLGKMKSKPMSAIYI